MAMRPFYSCLFTRVLACDKPASPAESGGIVGVTGTPYVRGGQGGAPFYIGYPMDYGYLSKRSDGCYTRNGGWLVTHTLSRPTRTQVCVCL